MKKRRVGILFGGPSAEHDVSRASAEHLLALLRHQYQPILIGVTKKRWWVTGVSARQLLMGESPTRSSVEPPFRLFRTLAVVWPTIHGAFGEDGVVQGFFETLQLPFIGSGLRASALGMDKFVSRQLFAAAGLDVPKTVRLTGRLAPVNRSVRKMLGWPVVVKPNAAGSSVGIALANTPAELAAAIRQARQYDTAVLLEEYIAGREFTVTVWGSQQPRAFPVIEIQTTSSLFSLTAKYDGVYAGTTQELCPAPISVRLRQQLQAVAIAAHQALGCRGTTRTDLRVTPRGRIVVLEVNTVPGLTLASLVPRAIQASGMSLGTWVRRSVQEALAPV